MHLYQMLIKLTMLGVVLAATTTAATAADLALPNCQSTCDKLSIPYPFGTSPGCYLDESFLITCNSTHFNPPKPFLTKSNIEVLNISLEGELKILIRVAYDCYNSLGKSSYSRQWLRLSKFPISNTKNKFTAVGCDTYAVIRGLQGRKYATGCLSFCDKTDEIDGSCSGIGCCQTTIPKGVRGFKITVDSYDNHTDVLAFNPCSYAFVVEDGAFTFSSYNLQDRTKFPLVLDWAIGYQTCEKAKNNQTSYACKKNSNCTNSENGPGYRCSCLDGFQGNPYLTDGCQDINECETLSPCNMTCNNLPGSYNCSCPVGYEGDGWKNGTGCSHKVMSSHQSKNNIMNIALGISIGLLTLLLGISWLYLGLRQRKLIKLKEKFFEQNGGNLLRQQLAVHGGSGETTKIFGAEELKKATNNYHESRILGQGGQGTVYKGILPDNRIVAIKKSIIGDQSQVEQFINEVIVLSQINHRNVVKILGCCLETQVPLLVYEFVTNGTLFDHMHKAANASIPWEVRLKIATETAGAISYLHSAASIPIIHRDIKSSNILLDDNFTAKVSDFGASRLIPLDQTQLTTLVQGTLGYLDPEYFHTSQLTQKSDVYSFGVVLVELLTGKVALSFERPPKERNLVTSFVSSMKEDRLLQVLDHQVVTERNVEQLKEVAMLARGCVRVKGEERPTMKEVASELEGLRAMERHPWVKGDLNAEEAEYLLGEPNTHGGGSTSSTAGFDSLKNQVAFEIEGGR